MRAAGEQISQKASVEIKMRKNRNIVLPTQDPACSNFIFEIPNDNILSRAEKCYDLFSTKLDTAILTQASLPFLLFFASVHKY